MDKHWHSVHHISTVCYVPLSLSIIWQWPKGGAKNVNAGLVKSNDSLSPGMSLITLAGQLPGQHLGSALRPMHELWVWGLPYVTLYTIYSTLYFHINHIHVSRMSSVSQFKP